MEQRQLKELEEQCIQDCAPPCTSLCPVHVDIRQMLLAIGKGDFSEGLKILRKSVPFPGIIAHTCDQPCQTKCNRIMKGGAIKVAELEQACTVYSDEQPLKITVLPKKRNRIAVIGAGLSGLTAAFNLSKKGYQVSLFDQEKHLGGHLWDIPADLLPRDLIEKETSLVSRAGVEIHLGKKVVSDDQLLVEFDAVYLGTGKAEIDLFPLEMTGDGNLLVNPDTFQTSQAKVFAGGSLLHPYSSILSISDGRRAAISIDRFLQNVSISASRVNEGPYETRLYTNIGNVVQIEPVVSAQQENGFTVEEAKFEAERCLQCECMECVKVCEYLKHYGSYPKKYVREIYNNLSIIMQSRTANKFINSCTLCGLCGEVCPTDLNMGQVIYESRQTMVKTSKMPPSAHDFALRDMAFSNSDKFALTLSSNKSNTNGYLFFPGCQLAASNPDYIPKIYQAIQSVIPDTGLMLRCCGAPADWSGEERIFHQNAEITRSEWQSLGCPIFILACSSCKQMLNKSLPEAETISLWEIYEQHDLYPKDNPLAGRQFVVHDPCTSRYDDVWQDSIRTGLTSLGNSYRELPMSRNLTECCGYGGVAWLANPELVHDIIQRRAVEDSADYLTYCVMCRDFFANEGKRTLHLLDLLYGKDLDLLSTRKGPDYSQRHENRARVKQTMLKLLSGKDDPKVESYESYQLELNPEVQARIEMRLILVEDIQKVIEHAETSGERFVNQESGHSLAYYKPNIITYWVEYTKNGDVYQIHDAYSHRMDFEGDASV